MTDSIPPAHVGIAVLGTSNQGTCYRHAVLWNAVQQLGGIKNLAEALQVDYQLVHNWVNLKWCPPVKPNFHWTQAQLLQLDQRLQALTHQNLEQLFPQSLRMWARERKRPKKKRPKLPIAKRGLLLGSIRDSLPDPSDVAINHELNQLLRKVTRILPRRLGEIVVLRYGLHDGKSHTLKQLGKCFRLGESRIQQLEALALRKLHLIISKYEPLYPFIPEEKA